MSKSKGDFLTVSLLEKKGYNPLVYRLFCLQSHYRKPLEFSYDALDNVASQYSRLKNRISALNREGAVDETVIDSYRLDFMKALADDLNTSMAVTKIYDVLKADITDAEKYRLIEEFEKVLSLGLLDEETSDVNEELESYINEKIAERLEAKKNRDYATADAIRNELAEKGIILKDTKDGTTWEKA